MVLKRIGSVRTQPWWGRDGRHGGGLERVPDRYLMRVFDGLSNSCMCDIILYFIIIR